MKMSSLKKVVANLSVLAIVFCLVSFASQQKEWVVPASDAAIKNPVKAEAASIEAGKVLYTKSCLNLIRLL